LKTKLTMVRYTIKPDRVSENVDLVTAVYEQLNDVMPEGLRYATFHDGSGGFVHLAVTDGDRDTNPLLSQPAFNEFTAAIEARCDNPPVAVQLEEVGSYRFLNDHILADDQPDGHPAP
jgi:hypothetical protein